MATEDDLRRLAPNAGGTTALPETVEGDDGGFSVRGKGFAWRASDREAPTQPRRILPGVWAVRTPSAEEKLALMDAEPDIYFSTPHYNGYPAVLVRLAAVDPDELGELLTDGWRVQAPKRLAKQFDAAGGGSGDAG